MNSFLSTTIVIALLTGSLGAHAEVRESEFGRDEGYRSEIGWPFGTTPKIRVGAFTGKGLPNLERIVGDFWMQPASKEKEMLEDKLPYFQNIEAKSILSRHPVLGMLLIKNNKIVFEGYQYGSNKETLFDSQSIAKPMTALAIGALIDDGKLSDLNLKMADVVPVLKPSPIGASTIKQALQMQCGHAFSWSDAEGSLSSAGRYAKIKFALYDTGSQDLYPYFALLPKEEPGIKFSYDPHCSDALSMLVTEISGRPLRKYFESRIWQRIKPGRKAAWLSPVKNPEMTSGANSFYASLRDFGKLAMLFMNGGKSDDDVIISEGWINKMHGDLVDVGAYTSDFKKYGYQTWVKDSSADSWFAGLGWQGQRFYIDRKNKSAMIIFALDSSHIKDSDAFWNRFRK